MIAATARLRAVTSVVDAVTDRPGNATSFVLAVRGGPGAVTSFVVAATSFEAVAARGRTAIMEFADASMGQPACVTSFRERGTVGRSAVTRLLSVVTSGWGPVTCLVGVGWTPG